jgi:hypothetical protein
VRGRTDGRTCLIRRDTHCEQLMEKRGQRKWVSSHCTYESSSGNSRLGFRNLVTLAFLWSQGKGLFCTIRQIVLYDTIVTDRINPFLSYYTFRCHMTKFSLIPVELCKYPIKPYMYNVYLLFLFVDLPTQLCSHS